MKQPHSWPEFVSVKLYRTLAIQSMGSPMPHCRGWMCTRSIWPICQRSRDSGHFKTGWEIINRKRDVTSKLGIGSEGVHVMNTFFRTSLNHHNFYIMIIIITRIPMGNSPRITKVNRWDFQREMVI